MCAIAGFFTGCRFADRCADTQNGLCRALSAETEHAFRGWYTRASLRRAPRRMFEEGDETLDLFPRRLVPHLSHPLVAKANAETISRLLTYTLYRFLTFTVNLEMQLVNDTTRRLIMNELPLTLDGPTTLNAQKLICDEAYHALFCADLLEQGIKLTEITPLDTGRPQFMHRVEAAASASDAPGVTRFLYTAVSEMLISATLFDTRVSGDVPSAVRGVMADHAADEVRHHVFYRELLRAYFGTLDREAAVAAASVIPEAVAAYMEPDLNGVRGDLLAVDFSRDDAEQILAETYAEVSHSTYVADATRELYRFLEEMELSQAAQVDDVVMRVEERLVP